MAELDWMHPSYRDLVIDELVTDKELRKKFLCTASILDISLALSTIGGQDGKRTMPLIVDEESRNIIDERVNTLFAAENEYGKSNLLTILDYARKQNGSQSEWITNALYKLLISFPKLMHGKSIYSDLLDYYCDLTLDFKPLLPLPDFEPTWNYRVMQLKEIIDEGSNFYGAEIESWAKLISILKQNEPRFLTQINYPDSYYSLVSGIFDNLEVDIASSIFPVTKDTIKNEIDRINGIIAGIDELSKIEIGFQNKIASIEYSLEQKRDKYAESIREKEDPEFDEIDDQPIDLSGFDIDQLFSDL